MLKKDKNRLKTVIKVTTDTLDYHWAPKARETNVERMRKDNMILE